ncbi:MAG: VWA domain-containing protein [Marinobacter sp.]|uniref:vWA domain-containing protein n=1 Tax=Marinobacter sp. TaxID=50741 RepID=UPI00299F07AF|nr:VWA domain-containing protein [Marinobacter sp.]MDX1636043.1 VWA domain-containing protein [Marinobacter sp.]
MSDLHFLRPLWLLLLLVLPLLPAVVRQARQRESGWSRVIPPALLRPLLRSEGSTRQSPRLAALPLVLAWVLLSLALAGPAWREAPTPLTQQNDSLVIALNLSLSMLATDVSPDRLTLAKRKIRDLLQTRDGSLNALVVYAGDAHVVTPLTDDNETIEALLGVLDPIMMPATGNRADLAVAKAKELLERGGRGKGRILLITDDIRADHRYDIRAMLETSPYPLSAIVVGTEAGGPIPLPKQGFIRDNGEIVIVSADPEALAQLTARTGGASHPLTVDNSDLRALDLRARDSDDWRQTEQDLSVSRWQDDGYWLLWLALPLLLLGWRRGALLAVVIMALPLAPRPAMALDWADLWARPDQRGQALIQRDPEQAAERFEDPAWRGSALYRAGEFEAASKAFERAEGADARYNQGNALARAGQLEQALAAYEQALAQAPEHEDARHNRDLVKELLEQQQEQQNGENGDQSQDSQQQESQNGDQGQQQPQGDQQPSDGQPSEQPDAGDSQQRQQQGRESEDNQQPQQSQAQQPRQLDGTPEDADESEQPPPDTEGRQLSQSQEQWLRRIPDDPGGLLRRKFQQQYQERDTQPDEGDTPW